MSDKKVPSEDFLNAFTDHCSSCRGTCECWMKVGNVYFAGMENMILPPENKRNPINRAEGHYKLKHLYNCDVCWTCRIFNPNTFKCGYYAIEEDKKISIKNPEFFRCTFWEDGHYWRSNG